MHSNHTHKHTHGNTDTIRSICVWVQVECWQNIAVYFGEFVSQKKKRAREREGQRPAGKISSVVLPDCARLTHIVVDNESIKLLERERARCEKWWKFVGSRVAYK